MSTDSGVTTSSTVDRLTGRVKWFNNKAGYGFVTVTDGAKTGTDVFVHHSSIGVSSEQYRYLVQGEYVEFLLSDVKTGTHEFQASSVSGIKGGKLMCETRNEYRNSRSTHNGSSVAPTSAPSTTNDVKVPRQRRAPTQSQGPSQGQVPRNTRARGEGPREGDGKDWTLVKRGTQVPSGGDVKPRRGRPPSDSAKST